MRIAKLALEYLLPDRAGLQNVGTRIVLSQCAAAGVSLDRRRHKYERQ
jgi:hypothetical protein